jgi:hypothetical protein
LSGTAVGWHPGQQKYVEGKLWLVVASLSMQIMSIYALISLCDQTFYTHSRAAFSSIIPDHLFSKNRCQTTFWLENHKSKKKQGTAITADTHHVSSYSGKKSWSAT